MPPGLVEPRKAKANGQCLAMPPGLVEPRKIALPTRTTTMAAALAAVNSPEALAAARRTKYAPLAGSAAGEPAVVVTRANARELAPVTGLTSTGWSMFKTPDEEPARFEGLSGREDNVGPTLRRASLFDAPTPGAFTTSESLQRSLEQLLRQQSLRFAAEEARASKAGAQETAEEAVH